MTFENHATELSCMQLEPKEKRAQLTFLYNTSYHERDIKTDALCMFWSLHDTENRQAAYQLIITYNDIEHI